MATKLARFDLRIPSKRTGRLVLPALNMRRVCACCQVPVATGWVLPSGDSVSSHCEAIVSRATAFRGSLDDFAARVHRLDGVATERCISHIPGCGVSVVVNSMEKLMSNETAHDLLSRSLPPGVESVARGDGAMIVRFSDGTEATVVRSFLAWTGDVSFELWLPRDERTGMAEMMPKLSRHEVLACLGQIAAEVARRPAKEKCHE